MYSMLQIAENCNRKSFDRGRVLAQNPENILMRYYADFGWCAEASARVHSSSGITDFFDTSIDLDHDKNAIVDFSCNCPAARKYDGLCKHAVALAIAFKSEPESFEGYADSLVAKTSRNLRSFMDSIPDTKLTYIQNHSVHLEVELANTFGDWLLRLKVEHGDVSYVVSDIYSFIEAVSNGSYLEYGKKLAFVHLFDSFDTSSQAIIHVLVSLQGNERFGRRSIGLSEYSAVRILDALSDNSFTLSTNPNDEADRHIVSIKDENPSIALRIVRQDDGYEIMRDTSVVIATDGIIAYVIYDGEVYKTNGEFCDAARFFHDIYMSSDDDIFIADSDIAEFCKKIMPGLEKSIEIECPPELEALKPITPEFSFYFDKIGKGRSEAITVEAKVSYNKNVAVVGEFNNDDDFYRDTHAENKVLAELAKYFNAESKLYLDDEDVVGELLYGGVASFQQFGEVYTTEAFDRLTKDRNVTVAVGLSVVGNLIELDVHSTDVSKDELAAILQSVQRKRKFHRLTSGAIASIEDLNLKELERLSSDFGITPSDIRKGNIEIPAYHALYLDREYSETFRNKSFNDYVARFNNESLYDYEVPNSLSSTLRPYQIDGFRWFKKLSSIGFGGILADEMGLGKSVQLIAYIKSHFEANPSSDTALIVAPASVVYNWQEEFKKFAPDLNVCVVDGLKHERARKRTSKNVQVFVCSYDIVRTDVEQFELCDYSIAALDEAQFIKNQGTKTSRATRRLKATHRFALTGTPIENRLSEIWSIFDFVMPGFLGTYAQFKKRFEIDIMGEDDVAAARLRALVEPFVLRRLKKEVLKELPAKQETVVAVPMTGAQEKLYLAEEQQLREGLLAQRRARKACRQGAGATARAEAKGLQIDILAELLRLRQIALDPTLAYDDYKGDAAKTPAIIELVEQMYDSGEKALVFSQFTSYLDILKAELNNLGIAYYEITGATEKKRRVQMAKAFNTDDTPVFLVSLKAGGTGLNLTGASVVIHADPWWNSAAINQATDRAHRIGQNKMVSVYKMIAKGTIEERILQLQAKKQQLSDAIVSSTSIESLSSLTREELESLLFD